jgi:hypothetical protein
MYKVYIILFLVCLVIIYLSTDCNAKEHFADTPPTTTSYTPAEKDKILQVLKDNYEMDALFNIAQVAKGLQSTTGYTVPGNLKIAGDLQVGSNITISSGTNGDVITVGNGTTATNGKTKINIGKYSLVPNLSGTDDYIELRYNKDGVATNDKVLGKFSRTAGDKAIIYTNDDNSNYFFINSEPSLGMYNNTPNSSGNIGRLRVDNINVNSVNRPDGNSVIITNNNNETKLCDGSANCNKYVYVRSTENQAGLYKRDGGDIRFNVHGSGNASTSLKNTNGLGEVYTNNIKKTGTEQTRVRLLDNETNICGEDNCDAKQFFVKYGEPNARAGIQSNSENSDFELINSSDRKYKIKTWLQQFEIGPANKDNSWYNATIIHNTNNPNNNDIPKFKVCSRDDCGQSFFIGEYNKNLYSKLAGPQSDEVLYGAERKDGKQYSLVTKDDKVKIYTVKNGKNWSERESWGYP